MVAGLNLTRLPPTIAEGQRDVRDRYRTSPIGTECVD